MSRTEINQESLAELEQRLGYSFHARAYLEKAFVHTSYINECPDKTLESNERLEFLGDAVLELIVSDLLLRLFPGASEGTLTRRRSQIVCEASFSYIGEQFGIGERLLLGKGEEASGGRAKPSIVADCWEAICGAIYLDGGYDFLYTFFEQNLERIVEQERERKRIFIDYKSKLQEWLHRQSRSFSYEVVAEEGAPHDKRFTVALRVDRKVICTQTATNKKKAEQRAAQFAWEQIEKTGRL